MREDALQPAQLDSPDLKVVDVVSQWERFVMVTERGCKQRCCRFRTPAHLCCQPLPPLPSPPQGGGTGFCTQGIVAAGVRPDNITLIDQSPQQLDKARGKVDLRGVTILEVRTECAGEAPCAAVQHGSGGLQRCRLPCD